MFLNNFREKASLNHLKAMARHIGRMQAYCYNHPEWREYMTISPANLLPDAKKSLDEGVEFMRTRYPDQFTCSNEQIKRLETYAENNKIMLRVCKLR